MTLQRPTSLLLIAGLGGLSALLYGNLALQSQDYGDATLWSAGLTYGGAGLCSMAAALLSRRLLAEHSNADDALLAGPHSVFVWVLLFAVLFRVLGVLTFPVFEDDMYRYLWDGRMFVESGSPYGVPPSSIADESLNERFSDIAGRINFPDIATVYGPALQLVFAASYLLAPGELWPLQGVMALADVALLVALIPLMQRDAPAQWVCWVLLAWSPLLIKEFATTAHPDVLGALCVVFALYARRTGRSWLMGVLLALAVGVKPFALVIAPFCIGFDRRAMVGFGMTIVALTLPYLSAGSASLWATALTVWLPEGLRAMGSGWLFNAGLYELGLALGPVDPGLLRTSLLSLFAGLWGWQLWRALLVDTTVDASSVLVWLIGIFLLILPALNPWYLVWWLPFAVLRPAFTPWVASFAVFLSYVSGINLGVDLGESADSGDAAWNLYSIPGWVLAVEFGLVAFGLVMDGRRYRRQPASSSL